jgi:single-strand DNA-binding protein
MINKVILIGNLGKDPEVRYLEGNVAVARVPMATNENFLDRTGTWQSRTEWHDIVMWRQLAERAEKTLKKGMLIFVEGKLTHRKWQDKEGQDRYTTEVVAATMRILEKREPSDQYNSSDPGPQSNDMDEGNNGQDETATNSEDDLPF